MTSYLFPIFMFGLLITGIVFLGVLQAVEWAKRDALRKNQADDPTSRLDTLTPKPVDSSNGAYRR